MTETKADVPQTKAPAAEDSVVETPEAVPEPGKVTAAVKDAALVAPAAVEGTPTHTGILSLGMQSAVQFYRSLAQGSGGDADTDKYLNPGVKIVDKAATPDVQPPQRKDFYDATKEPEAVQALFDALTGDRGDGKPAPYVMVKPDALKGQKGYAEYEARRVTAADVLGGLTVESSENKRQQPKEGDWVIWKLNAEGKRDGQAWTPGNESMEGDAARYRFVESRDGRLIYSPKAVPTEMVPLNERTTLKISWGEQTGGPGAMLVRYGPGDFNILTNYDLSRLYEKGTDPMSSAVFDHIRTTVNNALENIKIIGGKDISENGGRLVYEMGGNADLAKVSETFSDAAKKLGINLKFGIDGAFATVRPGMQPEEIQKAFAEAQQSIIKFKQNVVETADSDGKSKYVLNERVATPEMAAPIALQAAEAMHKNVRVNVNGVEYTVTPGMTNQEFSVAHFGTEAVMRAKERLAQPTSDAKQDRATLLELRADLENVNRLYPEPGTKKLFGILKEHSDLITSTQGEVKNAFLPLTPSEKTELASHYSEKLGAGNRSVTQLLDEAAKQIEKDPWKALQALDKGGISGDTIAAFHKNVVQGNIEHTANVLERLAQGQITPDQINRAAKGERVDEISRVLVEKAHARLAAASNQFAMVDNVAGTFTPVETDSPKSTGKMYQAEGMVIDSTSGGTQIKLGDYTIERLEGKLVVTDKGGEHTIIDHPQAVARLEGLMRQHDNSVVAQAREQTQNSLVAKLEALRSDTYVAIGDMYNHLDRHLSAYDNAISLLKNSEPKSAAELKQLVEGMESHLRNNPASSPIAADAYAQIGKALHEHADALEQAESTARTNSAERVFKSIVSGEHPTLSSNEMQKIWERRLAANNGNPLKLTKGYYEVQADYVDPAKHPNGLIISSSESQMRIENKEPVRIKQPDGTIVELKPGTVLPNGVRLSPDGGMTDDGHGRRSLSGVKLLTPPGGIMIDGKLVGSGEVLSGNVEIHKGDPVKAERWTVMSETRDEQTGHPKYDAYYKGNVSDLTHIRDNIYAFVPDPTRVVDVVQVSKADLPPGGRATADVSYGGTMDITENYFIVKESDKVRLPDGKAYEPQDIHKQAIAAAKENKAFSIGGLAIKVDPSTTFEQFKELPQVKALETVPQFRGIMGIEALRTYLAAGGDPATQAALDKAGSDFTARTGQVQQSAARSKAEFNEARAIEAIATPSVLSNAERLELLSKEHTLSHATVYGYKGNLFRSAPLTQSEMNAVVHALSVINGKEHGIPGNENAEIKGTPDVKDYQAMIERFGQLAAQAPDRDIAKVYEFAAGAAEQAIARIRQTEADTAARNIATKILESEMAVFESTRTKLVDSLYKESQYKMGNLDGYGELSYTDNPEEARAVAMLKARDYLLGAEPLTVEQLRAKVTELYDLKRDADRTGWLGGEAGYARAAELFKTAADGLERELLQLRAERGEGPPVDNRITTDRSNRITDVRYPTEIAATSSNEAGFHFDYFKQQLASLDPAGNITKIQDLSSTVMGKVTKLEVLPNYDLLLHRENGDASLVNTEGTVRDIAKDDIGFIRNRAKETIVAARNGEEAPSRLEGIQQIDHAPSNVMDATHLANLEEAVRFRQELGILRERGALTPEEGRRLENLLESYDQAVESKVRIDAQISEAITTGLQRARQLNTVSTENKAGVGGAHPRSKAMLASALIGLFAGIVGKLKANSEEDPFM